MCGGLRKAFGQRVAVDDASFSVADGECYGLLGPNGAGKTTIISMVCGLLSPDAGTVTVAGHPGGSRQAKAALGYVPQELALYPDLSAVDNLTFFGRVYGLKGQRLARRISQTLELVGLAERGHDRVGSYSGGMKRRANLAAGLLHEPRLLILDEPTVGVDPQSRNAILDTIGALGIAVLYTTHYMEEASKLCHRIGIIDDGHLVAEGTPQALITRHGGRDRVRLTLAPDQRSTLSEACLGLSSVHDVHPIDGGLELSTDHGPAVLPDVVKLASQLGLELTGVDVVAPDLEAVFLELTGKELRD